MLHSSFVKNDDQDFNPRKYDVINAKTIIIIIPESAESVEVLKKENNGITKRSSCYLCIQKYISLL